MVKVKLVLANGDCLSELAEVVVGAFFTEVVFFFIEFLVLFLHALVDHLIQHFVVSFPVEKHRFSINRAQQRLHIER